MPDMSKHSRRNTPSPLPAAWVVLVVMGTVSVAFQVYHAQHRGLLAWPLALLVGLGPVVASMGLTHIVALHRAGWLMTSGVFTVLGGAMVLSMGAIANVVRPIEPGWFAYLFGVVLDSAALIALGVIVKQHQRKAEAAAAEESALQRAEAAEAEASGLRATVADLEAATERLRAELDKVPPVPRRGGSPRKPSPGSARRKAAGSPRNLDPALADLDTEAQVLAILAAEPGISGNELGRRLGKTERYGRELVKRYRRSDAGVPGK